MLNLMLYKQKEQTRVSSTPCCQHSVLPFGTLQILGVDHTCEE